jgi:hypothetical protein
MDHRVDLFAAGVVLYELLRGSPHAQDLSDTEVLRKMRRAEFEPLTRTRPDVPKELDAIVRKSLGRRPRERYATCAEFRSKLLGFLQTNKIPYGRTELAGLMRQNFDEDRRRRRSGSYAGQAIAVGSGSHSRSAPAAHAPRSDTEILEEKSRSRASAASSPSVSGGQPWSAYSPTTASLTNERVKSGELSTSEMELSLGDVMEVVDEVAPPLRLPDSEKTLTYSPPIDPDEGAVESRLPTSALNMTVPEAGQPRMEPPDPSLPTAEMPQRPGGAGDELHRQQTERHQGEPLHRQQTERQAAEPLHRQQTERRDERGNQHGAGARSTSTEVPLPKASSHPTLSTGFFSNEGDTQREPDRRDEREARRRSQLRTLVGLSLVLVLGGGVVAALLLLQGPHLGGDRLDAGATVGLRRLLDAGVAPEAAPSRAVSTLRVRSKPPGAAIRYCGRPTGLVTPASVAAQPGRRCALELELAGHDIYRVEVTPTAGGRMIQATLRRSRSDGTTAPRGGTGVLRVTSIQVGTVYVDDQPKGRTPQLELKLPPGSYSVRMHFPALEVRTQARTVKVVAGRTTVTHFDPQP